MAPSRQNDAPTAENPTTKGDSHPAPARAWIAGHGEGPHHAGAGPSVLGRQVRSYAIRARFSACSSVDWSVTRMLTRYSW
jgi:hypothetical protein